MSVFETVGQKVFDLVTANAKVNISAAGQTKIASAFPKGDDPSTYGPWADQDIRQVSFEADPITTAGVEIDFKISYKTSAAGQYIDEVYADSIVSVPTPYSLDARIEFRDPNTGTSADGLEMAAIPFTVTVTRSHPVFGVKSFLANGVIQGDGNSTFSTFASINA